MSAQDTGQAIAAITDEGFFERLATAILRGSTPAYRSLVHPGVNVAGKTVKSPLDGIGFVPGSEPPHMIAVHHTTTAADSLERKWLHDPSTAKRRKRSRSAVPAGDLVKTGDVVADERKRTPHLLVTLVLTTNQEPDESLVRAVETAARARGMALDLWSRSRLADFLDNEPSGQWIRHSFLGIEQQQLSEDLFHDISARSLKVHHPPDTPVAWISRQLDTTLSAALHRDVTFLVASSGMGKSVACYRWLAAHVDGGGYGLVLPHEVIASTLTLELAITTALRQLHPSLAPTGPSVFSFCSPENPLLVVVEDIIRSGETQALIEKLASWSRTPTRQDDGARPHWRVVCPLWPEAVASLTEQVRRLVEPLIIFASGFTSNEGRDAVLARARLDGTELSSLSADTIASSLGNDPLLIALHDHRWAPDPHQIIGLFVDGSLSRSSARASDHPAAAYRSSLRLLARAMLANRQFEPRWREITHWAGLDDVRLRLLARVAHDGELMRLTGGSDDQRLLFRHDRVRDWLLADAASDDERNDLLADEIVREPYFAEVMGTVLARGHPHSTFVQRVRSLNPLALFHALRLFGTAQQPHEQAILSSIHQWLDDPATHAPRNSHLRWEALAMLAETDSPEVSALVRKFRERTLTGAIARLRNGDVAGGVDLCISIEPGVTAPWRDAQIEHAKLRHGRSLSCALEQLLRGAHFDGEARQGALRLAGHLAEPGLATALEACWTTDTARSDHIEDYLWAFAQCCGDNPTRYVGPVCDSWAALPDEPEREHQLSPRLRVAEYHLRWGFRRWPPQNAVAYLTQRASDEKLRWPITHLLHGMDHPDALLFVVHELAKLRRRLEGTDSFSPYLVSSDDEWRRAQENGHPMSQSCRDILATLWQSEANDRHVRAQAFCLWAATHHPDDIRVLRVAQASDVLAEAILRARLMRGDLTAIPRLIQHLTSNERSYWWWQYARNVWSDELTDLLDESLRKRGSKAKRTWGEHFEEDWLTHEMVQRLPVTHAERLLLKHWEHLRFTPHFVQTAFYLTTPRLLAAARTALDECPQPAVLMTFLSSHLGLRTKGRPGITRQEQLRVLAPYLHLVAATDLSMLWDVCNDHGWFGLRKEVLDNLQQPPFVRGWNRDRALAAFDQMTTDPKRLLWLHHELDDLLKIGVSWADILATLTEWFQARRSVDALRVVASAVASRGTRQDLCALKVHDGMPEGVTNNILADTEFAVRRRSLR